MDINDIIAKQISRCEYILMLKSQEYTPDNDKFKNFRIAAALTQTTPAKALWAMAAKHFASISELLQRDETNMELWTEKITDAINYLLLLRALLEEENEVDTRQN